MSITALNNIKNIYTSLIGNQPKPDLRLLDRVVPPLTLTEQYLIASPLGVLQLSHRPSRAFEQLDHILDPDHTNIVIRRPDYAVELRDYATADIACSAEMAQQTRDQKGQIVDVVA
ncbi:MAG: hypothetical protein HQK57_13710 [Deltaproteobacteria bacterium]|nr:hypothetical protein [Deltaproteobacteria bacterium]